MSESFDPSREPMRAIRDLIVLCESHGLEGPELDRARAAFTPLRALFGDDRHAEDLGCFEKMIEPPAPGSVHALLIHLSMLPLDAAIQVDLDEEFRDFALDHQTVGDAHLVAIIPE